MLRVRAKPRQGSFQGLRCAHGDDPKDRSGVEYAHLFAGTSKGVRNALRVIAIAVWAGGLIALTTWSNTDGAATVAVMSTVLVGATVGRWWLLLVPVPPALLLIAGAEGDYEWSRGDWILFIGLATLAIEVLLVAGLLLNWGVRGLASRVRDNSAAHP